MADAWRESEQVIDRALNDFLQARVIGLPVARVIRNALVDAGLLRVERHTFDPIDPTPGRGCKICGYGRDGKYHG
jgi:hypothetical protein